MSGTSRRLLSVDALRGFDMLVIIGLDALVHAMARVWPVPPLAWLSNQFTHAEWAGVHAYDLVFPLFIFLSGVSLAIVDARPSSAAMSRRRRLAWAARRMLILVLLGIVYNFGGDWSWDRLRFPSVLGLIGVSYFIAAATLILLRGWKARIGVGLAIAGTVAALHLVYPVPEHGAGLLTAEGSVNGYLDRLLLPGRLHAGSYDPEGLLGMLSAATIALAGAGAGAVMVSGHRYSGPAAMGLAGLVNLATGIAIGAVYPPIKAIWTVSFDLIAIGCCLFLLAAARRLFDGEGTNAMVRRLGEVPAPIGANAILAYMLARFLIYPLYPPLATLSPLWEVAGLCALIVIQWTLLRWLFARGWSLRV
ncbi:hypothetical protein [Qipengyuania sp.]|uniref:hypothetical protein n=1 Tax=Qipengyuania sp. TaxID=2004515 RepID=UPI003BACD030